jgi:hypothetical protein
VLIGIWRSLESYFVKLPMSAGYPVMGSRGASVS